MTMRVLVADDHPLFRQALVMVLARLDPALGIEEYGTLQGALAALETWPAARLLILDLVLPDSRGFEGLVTMTGRFPGVPVAVVSANEDRGTVRGALACGASAFIPKSTGLAALGEALRAIFSGERWFPDEVDDRFDAHDPERSTPLSPAQARVWSGLQRGLMNKQIAHELGVTEATVKAHLTGLFRRLGVHSRTQALLLARGSGGNGIGGGSGEPLL